jgi:hypothetical protein
MHVGSLDIGRGIRVYYLSKCKWDMVLVRFEILVVFKDIICEKREVFSSITLSC